MSGKIITRVRERNAERNKRLLDSRLFLLAEAKRELLAIENKREGTCFHVQVMPTQKQTIWARAKSFLRSFKVVPNVLG